MAAEWNLCPGFVGVERVVRSLGVTQPLTHPQSLTLPPARCAPSPNRFTSWGPLTFRWLSLWGTFPVQTASASEWGLEVGLTLQPWLPLPLAWPQRAKPRISRVSRCALLAQMGPLRRSPLPEVWCVILVLSRWGQEDQARRVILSYIDASLGYLGP